MTATVTFITISIVVLAMISMGFFLMRGKQAEARITPLASLAFGFVIAGIIFGEDRRVGYSLIAIGIILAVADAFNQIRQK